MAARRVYLYGRHPVQEALRARPSEIQRLFVASSSSSTRHSDLVGLAERLSVPVVNVSKRRLSDLVGAVPHQGVVAAVAPFAYASLEDVLAASRKVAELPLLLALDQLKDPQNLGALVRSALALGAHGVVLPKHRSCEITPSVVKSSAGATAQLPIARVTNLRRALEELKEQELWVVGAAAGSGTPIHRVDFRLPTVIVIGSEGEGMRRLVAAACDVVAHIPMPGPMASLNASVAGALCLYEAMRQRTHEGKRMG